ncbi:hypothetical protein [Pseudorhodoferax soli]|uniref:hypothetical protein n=1 Tax=Pseudorhodoferax soli TaxID=545864 RepID=UPI001B864DD3|nr:hypothetical protein [Pseudorhodoferax soli]
MRHAIALQAALLLVDVGHTPGQLLYLNWPQKVVVDGLGAVIVASVVSRPAHRRGADLHRTAQSGKVAFGRVSLVIV